MSITDFINLRPELEIREGPFDSKAERVPRSTKRLIPENSLRDRNKSTSLTAAKAGSRGEHGKNEAGILGQA